MFTSPINLLVDFLFIDILSAPTVDSLKLDRLDTFNRLTGAMSTFGSNAVVATRRLGRRISQAAVQSLAMGNKQPSMEEKIQRTRSIPPGALEAQIIASRTASQLMSEVRQVNSTQVARRKTERESSVTNKRLTTRKQRKRTTRSSAPLPPEDAVETLFTDLCVDIIEQRKQLPPNQQEVFDEKWG